MKALLIAEKNSVRKNIEQAYMHNREKIPYELDCFEMHGHLMRLKLPNEIDTSMAKWDVNTLPFNPKDYNGYEYTVIAETQNLYDRIKDAYDTGDYDFIIHAGDSDMEGELLVRLLLNSLDISIPVKRFWVNASTENEYLNGLLNLRDDDNDPLLINLYHAGLMRQHADYLLGMNGSVAAGCTFNLKGASVGRTVSAVLNMIVTREEEIKNFVSKTEYGVAVTYGPHPFVGNYFDYVKSEKDGKEVIKEEYVFFKTPQEAKELISKLPETATVRKVEKKKKVTKAPKLYNLGDIQVDAAAKFSYDADETLNIIQSLYDKKYLTYPRTDCNYISPELNLKRLLDVASVIPGGEIVDTITNARINEIHSDKTYINKEECGKHGHTALMVTDIKPNFNSFTEEEKNIYNLVAQRFISIFLQPLIQELATIYTKAENYNFKSTGKIIVDKGFTDFIHAKFKDIPLPDVKENDVLTIKGQVTKREATPPKRFSKSTLVIALNKPAPFLKNQEYKTLKDRLHIGTSSTQGSLIKKLKDKHYVEVKNDIFYPTQLGMQFAKALRCSDIVDVDTTAIWELKLDDIKHGIMDYKEFEKEIEAANIKMINDIKNSPLKITAVPQVGAKVCSCPLCKGNVIEGNKGYFCENYPEDKGACKFRLPKEFPKIKLKITLDDLKNLCSGKKISKTLTKNNSSWKQDLIYDVESSELKFIDADYLGYNCPICGKELNNDKYALSCSCGFTITKSLPKHVFTKNELETLLEGKKTKPIKLYSTKKNKYYTAELVLDPQNNYKLSFAQSENIDVSDCRCPVCGNTLTNEKYNLTCSCGFNLTKSLPKHIFTKEEINTLLNGGTTKPLKIYSTNKKRFFNASLYLDENNGYKIKFKF